MHAPSLIDLNASLNFSLYLMFGFVWSFNCCVCIGLVLGWLFKVSEILILAQDMNLPKYLCMKKVFCPNLVLFGNCCIKYFDNSGVRELLQWKQKQIRRNWALESLKVRSVEAEGGERNIRSWACEEEGNVVFLCYVIIPPFFSPKVSNQTLH